MNENIPNRNKLADRIRKAALGDADEPDEIVGYLVFDAENRQRVDGETGSPMVYTRQYCAKNFADCRRVPLRFWELCCAIAAGRGYAFLPGPWHAMQFLINKRIPDSAVFFGAATSIHGTQGMVLRRNLPEFVAHAASNLLLNGRKVYNRRAYEAILQLTATMLATLN